VKILWHGATKSLIIGKFVGDMDKSKFDVTTAVHSNSNPKFFIFLLHHHSELNRDLVYITMSFFDRYLSRLPVLDHMMIHLVAMTSLYLATKVHSIKKISIATIISLSGGLLSKDQVLGMEQSIMKSLEWYLNPPTPALFVTVLYPLMEKLTDDEDIMVEIKDLAIHLLELAVYDSCYFIDKPPSLMAHAAIMQAMNLLAIPMETQKRLEALPKSNYPFSIEDCSYRLHHIYCKKYERFDAQHSIHSPHSPSPTTVQW
jgi:hypothetical protein